MYFLITTKSVSSTHITGIRRCYCKNLWHSKQSFSNVYLLHHKDITPAYIFKHREKPFGLNQHHIPTRSLYIGPLLKAHETSSKVEETIKNIKEEKEKNKSETVSTKAIDIFTEKTLIKKQTLWQKVRAELLHYYHGFRLLGLDMKVSVKLIWRILQGNDLNRREHRLLIKTTGDVFRLIPFSVFIIVPFMEFLLPIAIKFFPGLLPSTFQTTSDKEDKLKQALKVKIEMAKFLQKTLDEMAVQSSNHRSEKAKEFAEFFYKVRTSGTIASNEEIMKFSKLFEDEITLDSLSRQQLVALCRVLDVQTFGTTNFLRFLLRMKLRSLAADDRLIEKEGIITLTRHELQQACRARGMRAYGMSEQKLREQLSQWLDLSLNKRVPPSLLLLSRALMVPETISMPDKLKATISALPDSVVARTKGAIGEKEGKLDHKTNIEIIKMEEKKIEEEREEEKKLSETGIIHERAISKMPEKEDEITAVDVKVLEQALDSVEKEKKKMSIEKEELKELKVEMAEYQEDIQELHQLKAETKGLADIESLKVSTGAKLLFVKVNKMINKMDDVLSELELSEKKMKEEIGLLTDEKKSKSQFAAELIKIDELIAAIKKIQSIPDDRRLARITEILGKIDDDRDGAIKIEDVLKVLELIGKEDIKLSKKQVNEIIELLEKEEVLLIETQIQKALKKETRDIENDEEFTLHRTKATSMPITDSIKINCSSSGSRKTLEESKKKNILETLNENESSSDSETPTSDSKNSNNEPITSNVTPTSKKAEGSKRL